MVSQELRDKGSRVEIVEEQEDVTSENNNVIAKNIGMTGNEILGSR